MKCARCGCQAMLNETPFTAVCLLCGDRQGPDREGVHLASYDPATPVKGAGFSWDALIAEMTQRERSEKAV